MDVQTNPGAEGAPAEAPVTVIQGTGEGRLSVSEAGRMLREARKSNESSAPERAETPAPVDPRIKSGEQESTTGPDPVEDAAPREEVRSETQSADPVETLPPIEAPRSWTKEDKELFTRLPRETQERVAERERSRESDFLRRQNEAAEKLKGLTAQEQKVEQARQQYESALPLLLENLQSAMTGEFSDIKMMADVQKMASEDWPRYVRWDAQQKQVAAVQQEMRGAEERRNAELAQQWTEFARREDSLFTEKVPEMADRDKAAKLQSAAVSVLKDLGFSDEELSRSYHGKQGMSLRDHRVQLLVRDAILWREAQAKAKAATVKPVPPVQRPGVSQGKGAEREAQLQNLNQQLDKASGVNALRAAAKLVAARRASR